MAAGEETAGRAAKSGVEKKRVDESMSWSVLCRVAVGDVADEVERGRLSVMDNSFLVKMFESRGSEVSNNGIEKALWRTPFSTCPGLDLFDAGTRLKRRFNWRERWSTVES